MTTLRLGLALASGLVTAKKTAGRPLALSPAAAGKILIQPAR
ncbi:MAG: hypothetical protein NT062_24165 [Proteobacteria bacterium]|nr:hypothetical protein [Pseudomonadota bacterium]